MEMVDGRATFTRTLGVLRTRNGTPPIGTPRAKTQGGNSTPALALVAGFSESERVGERGASK